MQDVGLPQPKARPEGEIKVINKICFSFQPNPFRYCQYGPEIDSSSAV